MFHTYTPTATLYTLQCTLCTPHSTLHTPHSTLHTPHFTLHLPDSTLFTPHFGLSCKLKALALHAVILSKGATHAGQMPGLGLATLPPAPDFVPGRPRAGRNMKHNKNECKFCRHLTLKLSKCDYENISQDFTCCMHFSHKLGWRIDESSLQFET